LREKREETLTGAAAVATLKRTINKGGKKTTKNDRNVKNAFCIISDT